MLSKEAIDYRNKLADLLAEDGYPDYANALYGFKSLVLVGSDHPILGCCSQSSLVLNEKLTDEEACFVARHEIRHVLQRHHERCGKRHPSVWNIAADLEISNFYSEDDVELLKSQSNIKGGLSIDLEGYTEYRGKTAEEIYDQMLAQGRVKIVSIKVSASGPPGQGGAGGGSKESQDENAAGEPLNEEELDEEAKKLLGELVDLDKKIAKNLHKKLSEARSNEPTKEQKEGKPTPKRTPMGTKKERSQNTNQNESDENKQPKPDKEEIDETEDETEDEDLDIEGNGVGTEHAERKVEEPVPTKVRLQRSLKGVFGRQKFYAPKMTYSKYNKRYLTPPGAKETPMVGKSRHDGVIKKGKKRMLKEWMTLGVYCDVSGSMSRDKVSIALGTCEEIGKMKRCAVKTHYFDTEVRDEFFSGGGTDYRAVLTHAKEQKYKSVAIITDDSNSHNIPRGEFSFDNLWIIGVEHSSDDDKDRYSIGPQVVDGTIKVKKFDGFVVCTEDEMR